MSQETCEDSVVDIYYIYLLIKWAHRKWSKANGKRSNILKVKLTAVMLYSDFILTSVTLVGEHDLDQEPACRHGHTSLHLYFRTSL